MNTRDKMRDFRARNDLTIQQMARICQCSEGLLRMVEEGELTHPKIAARIARAYQLDVDDYNALVPKEYKAKAIPKVTMPPADGTWNWKYINKED